MPLRTNKSREESACESWPREDRSRMDWTRQERLVVWWRRLDLLRNRAARSRVAEEREGIAG